MLLSPSSYLKYPGSKLISSSSTRPPPSSVRRTRYLTQKVLKIALFPTKCPQAPLAAFSRSDQILLLAWRKDNHSSHHSYGNTDQTSCSCCSRTLGLPYNHGHHQNDLHLVGHHNLLLLVHKDSLECSIFGHCSSFLCIFDLQHNIMKLLIIILQNLTNLINSKL